MAVNKVPGHFAFELESKAEAMPDFEIVTFEHASHADEVLTYSDIVMGGRKVAAELLRRDIGRGDVFALVMRNQPEFIYAMYAASALGAVLLPIDPRTRGERLRYVLEDAKAAGIIFSAELAGEVVEVLHHLPDLKVIGVSYKDDFGIPPLASYPSLNAILAGPEVALPNPMNEDLTLPLEIIYTSGTTGSPKGIVIKGTRLSMFPMIAQFVFQYNGEDKLYTGLSLTHGNAQAVTLIPSLLLAIPSVISRKFTKSRIWDVCRQYGCTSFSLLGGDDDGHLQRAGKTRGCRQPCAPGAQCRHPATHLADL